MSLEELKMKMINSSWDPNTLELAIRANFKCEYCGCNFFATVNDYDSIQVDHIIPTSLLCDNSLNNLALACKTCNFIKRNWNPQTIKNKAQNRDELLKAAKDYILGKRKFKEQRMLEEKEYASELISKIINI